MEDDSLYESNDGFSTKIWGCPLWFVLHMITFNYPVHPTDADKHNYYIFFRALGFVLPCRVCRENYRAAIRRSMTLDDFASRHTLSRFLYTLHNNVPNHKPLPCSFEEMRKTYETFRSKCGTHGCIVPNDFVRS